MLLNLWRAGDAHDGDPAWRQQQKLLVHGENPGSAAGTEQRVVAGARLAQCERSVVQGPGLYGKGEKKSFVERANLVFPPTADPHGGWCGGWGLETRGYPIRSHAHRRHASGSRV